MVPGGTVKERESEPPKSGKRVQQDPFVDDL